jgi:hypothetical protein
VTQFKQQIEQLREIRRGIVSALSEDTNVDYRRKNEILAGSYFALTTLEKILEDLDKKNEIHDH